MPTDSKHDIEALDRFASGRWLWDESQQLACRYVKFDINLLKLAASAIGSKPCVQVVKISKNQYNKMFLLIMSDERKTIVKLSNLNAGRSHFTTTDEVTIMNFVQALFSFSFLFIIGEIGTNFNSWEMSLISQFRKSMHRAQARQKPLLKQSISSWRSRQRECWVMCEKAWRESRKLRLCCKSLILKKAWSFVLQEWSSRYA